MARVVAPYWRRALVRALLFGNGMVALRDAVAVATAAVAAHPLSRAVTDRWMAAHDRVVAAAIVSEMRLPPTWLRSLNSSFGGSERRRSARKRASVELSALTEEGRKGGV
ncbi:hypothetical protein I4F81_007263 [Pyropia yezoensis]|uniref:Uncharacterized protein n=1 Tax=Pyropia yezoensis TaxID=2788 RepID=A0ACC3C3L4_PYRYE|nr:hypothetical protein I4F81_007263 [Neopyropia yezoensis]